MIPIGKFSTLLRPAISYDVIISGGGMVGSTLAVLLGQSPLFKDKKILLIENSPKSSKPVGKEYSNRVSAINPSSKELFESVGMWKHISRYGLVNNIMVWDRYCSAPVEFSNSPNPTAFIVENNLIVKAATEEMSKLENVSVLYGTKVERVEMRERPAVVVGGVESETELLIGADGADSLVRRSMNVNYVTWKYNQFGLVATVRVSTEGNNTAWQKFLGTGPVALLPLDEHTSSLVWSTSVSEAERLMALPDDSFVDALNEALCENRDKDPLVSSWVDLVQTSLQAIRLSSPVRRDFIPPYVTSLAPSSRAKFPLGFGHSPQMVGVGVCLVGDACHRIHPLAGQGVNLGLSDIRLLYEALCSAIRSGRPLSHPSALKSYQTQALRHNLPIMTGVDLLHRLFTTGFTPVGMAAGTSFLLADAFPPVKEAMRLIASN